MTDRKLIKKTYRIMAAFTWELPQSIAAMIMLLILKKVRTVRNEGYFCYIFSSRVFSSCSLGEFIFFNEVQLCSDQPEIMQRHEYGHTVQSRILGPLYLIIVGIPSMFWNTLSRWSGFCRKHYYEMPIENWADKIAGISRK